MRRRIITVALLSSWAFATVPAFAQQIPGQDPLTNEQETPSNVPPPPPITVPAMPQAQTEPLNEIFDNNVPLDQPADNIQLFTPSLGATGQAAGQAVRPNEPIQPQTPTPPLASPQQTPPSQQSMWGETLTPPSTEALQGGMGDTLAPPSSEAIGANGGQANPQQQQQPQTDERGTFLREPGGAFPSDF